MKTDPRFFWLEDYSFIDVDYLPKPNVFLLADYRYSRGDIEAFRCLSKELAWLPTSRLLVIQPNRGQSLGSVCI